MTHDPRSALLSAALDVAARGWHVFPLRPGTKRPALHGADRCRATGDCARGHLKWQERATIDPHRITQCWETSPANIGLATGPSGLVVVDLDVRKNQDNGNSSADTPDGATTFKALCERTGHPVPTTYRVRTASGGQHLFFTAPAGIRLGNTAGTLAPLVDTRAWGGYVVAAGSTTPAGLYETVNDTAPVPLPGWLLELLQPAPARPVVPLRLPAVDGSRAALAALEAECATVAAAPEKQGNITLNRCAFKVGRFVAWGDLPRHVAENAFQAAGESRGLTAAECRSTIRSALDSSLRKVRPRETA
ncbi:bifunctional DNA primase/polymerase [Streptomyces ortus]|uniref:Bifunctional DNA primase/polymerase n=1 Tax=Streptomyces ortus TaxID=2867268 RepID=A0ABT3V9P5_9ACTN|nr:bifunctional DNA primase/polymerase [Streptomyces ortus]MCX4235380.1 bifunctional DNA primase/polymerase [Streptomyces ortus]